MNTLQIFWNTTWRSILVALGYVIGLTLSGVIGAMIGWQASTESGGGRAFIWLAFSIVFLILYGLFQSYLSTWIVKTLPQAGESFYRQLYHRYQRRQIG